MFKIVNLVEINQIFSRKTGDNVITQICRTVKDQLGAEYIFVRYMGPKFAVVFSGVEINSIEEYIKELKEKIETLKISPAEDYKGEITEVYPKINIALASYYKGTMLVNITKKLEEYLDTADSAESNINFL